MFAELMFDLGGLVVAIVIVVALIIGCERQL